MIGVALTSCAALAGGMGLGALVLSRGWHDQAQEMWSVRRMAEFYGAGSYTNHEARDLIDYFEARATGDTFGLVARQCGVLAAVCAVAAIAAMLLG